MADRSEGCICRNEKYMLMGVKDIWLIGVRVTTSIH